MYPYCLLKGLLPAIPCGLVVRIRRSHRRGRGSIPRMGVIIFFPFQAVQQPTNQAEKKGAIVQQTIEITDNLHVVVNIFYASMVCHLLALAMYTDDHVHCAPWSRVEGAPCGINQETFLAS